MTYSEYQSAYCCNCGQLCTPERYKRAPEDHERWFTGPRYVNDWRSPCCHDALSEDPVSDRCEECGATVDPRTDESFPDSLCPSCEDDRKREKERSDG